MIKKTILKSVSIGNYSYDFQEGSINSFKCIEGELKALPSSFDKNTIYTFPKLAVKRDKLKSVLDQTKSKIVRDITKADYVILPKDYRSYLSESQYCYILRDASNKNILTSDIDIKKDVLNLLESVKNLLINSGKSKLGINNIFEVDDVILTKDLTTLFPTHYSYYFRNISIRKLLDNIINLETAVNSVDEIAFIDCDYYFMHCFEYVLETASSNYKKHNLQFTSYYSKYYSKDVAETLTYLDDNNISLYSEDGLSTMIASDPNLVVIDDEMAKSLSEMLSSKDSENHVIALEIMGNCQYESSFYNVLDLLKKYRNKIIPCKAYKHKNFQTLINHFFDSVGVSYSSFEFHNIENLFVYLNKHNKLTPEIIKTHINQVIHHVKCHGETKLFKIKEIIIEGVPSDCEQTVTI